jgi:DNA-directed RNA polymerase specialized sigma subunit
MQWIYFFIIFWFNATFSMKVFTPLSMKILTNSQWSNINNILRITNDEHIQIKTRNVIYDHYERWAIQESHVFKRYHNYLCRDLRGDELAIYGLIGLKKAIVNYDPNKCGLFTKYADFYLKSELYKGVRKLLPLHSTIGENLWIMDYTPINKNEEIESFSEKWQFLRERLTDFEYRCATYKYSYEFIKEMSNKKIAELMACSEETVRKAIVKVNNNL